MAIESPEGSDVRMEAGSFSAALWRRLPRILLVTVVLVAATYVVLPFIPSGEPQRGGAITVTQAPSSVDSVAMPTGTDAQLAQLQQRVTDADSKAADFKIANDLYTGSNGTSLLDQQVNEAASRIAAAEARRDAATSQATLIRGLLDAGQPLDSVEDIRNSVAVQQLEQQKGQLTAQRAQLLATFLPSHPGVITATSQIAAIDKQIVAEAQRVASALDAQAKIESTGLDARQQNLAALKTKQAAETRNAVELDALQRDAAANRDVLQAYLARYGDGLDNTSVGASSSTAQASDEVAETSAAPSPAPAPRNTALILGLVALLSLALQIGALFIAELLSGRDGLRHEPAAGHEGEAQTFETHEPAAEREPYRHGEAIVDEPGSFTAPVAAVAGDAVAASPMTSQGLRRWFTRHAHAASAPEELPSEELRPESPALGESAFISAAPPVEASVADATATPAVEVPVERSQTASVGAKSLANLSADLILGRASIVVLASLGEPRDGELLAEQLASDALEHGLSVAHVDAGSQRQSTEPGITDLAADLAGFGDVVFKVKEGLAEIPWGQLASLDQDSDKPATLVEALSEVYEVVLVAAGALGSQGSLALFAELDTRLVLVGSATPAYLDACRAEALRLGYRQVEVLATPDWRAEVA